MRLLIAVMVTGWITGYGEGAPTPVSQDLREPVRVVTTLPVYADIVRKIGGSGVEVSSIAAPNEDSHFVRPKPSFAVRIRRAEMFVTTGLDLELWVPTLLDRAGNSSVAEGGRGYVTAYTGVDLLDIPTAVDRSGGDVHVFGNPHLITDPIRTIQVARNITVGLKRIAPDRSSLWDAGLESFTAEIHRRLFGETLIELLGGDLLADLALNGTLHSFLETEEWQGSPLIQELGGWLGVAEAFRGRDIICYHKNWAYLEDRFGVRCVDYVEAKPGIPPTPGHVADLLQEMSSQGLDVILAASYFDQRKVESVARRGGATVVVVPMNPGGKEGVDDYFSLVDYWVNGLAGVLSRPNG
jgi:zinc/manganese transport system substrate-binding protein